MEHRDGTLDKKAEGREILAAKMHKKHKRNPHFLWQMSPIQGDGTALRLVKKDQAIV
jgi:hypothetical protein